MSQEARLLLFRKWSVLSAAQRWRALQRSNPRKLQAKPRPEVPEGPRMELRQCRLRLRSWGAWIRRRSRFSACLRRWVTCPDWVEGERPIQIIATVSTQRTHIFYLITLRFLNFILDTCIKLWTSCLAFRWCVMSFLMLLGVVMFCTMNTRKLFTNK